MVVKKGYVHNALNRHSDIISSKMLTKHIFESDLVNIIGHC